MVEVGGYIDTASHLLIMVKTPQSGIAGNLRDCRDDMV